MVRGAWGKFDKSSGRVHCLGHIRGYADRWTPDAPDVVADRVRTIEADPPIVLDGDVLRIGHLDRLQHRQVGISMSPSRTPRRRVCSSGRSFGGAGARPSRIGGSTGGGGPVIGRDGIVAGGPAALPGQPWSGSGPGRAGAVPGHAGGGPSRRSPADLVRQHCERHGVRHLESPDGRPVAMSTCVLVGWLIYPRANDLGWTAGYSRPKRWRGDGGLDARSFRAPVHVLVEALRIVRAVRDSRRKPRGRGAECRGAAGAPAGGSRRRARDRRGPGRELDRLFVASGAPQGEDKQRAADQLRRAVALDRGGAPLRALASGSRGGDFDGRSPKW